MAHAVETTERGKFLVGALRTLAHTSRIDPTFLQQCIEASTDNNDAAFHSLLEQDEREFIALLEHAKGCRSALEIGSRYGKSVERIAGMMEPGSRVVAVDWPYATASAKGEPAEPILRATMENLGRHGYDATLFLGDSHAPSLVDAVRELGPFDFCFIDGDHSYIGAKADWENFGPMAKVVAFHDIINNPDCFRLWNEIKAAGYRTVEYTDSCWLGIGVVFKDQ